MEQKFNNGYYQMTIEEMLNQPEAEAKNEQTPPVRWKSDSELIDEIRHEIERGLGLKPNEMLKNEFLKNLIQFVGEYFNNDEKK